MTADQGPRDGSPDGADHGEVDEDDRLEWDALDGRLVRIAQESDPAAWVRLAGDLCEAWHRPEDAADLAGRAVRAGLRDAAFELGLALNRQGLLEQAAGAYRMAVDAGVVQALVNRGSVLERLDRPDEAREHYLRAVEAGDPLGHVRLGRMAEADGDLDEAERRYRVALEAGWWSAPGSLGILLAQQGRWAEAEPHLAEAARHPDESDPRSWYGLALRELGRPEQARQVLAAAVAAGEWESLLPLGNLLWDVDGDLPGAEELYRRANEELDDHAPLNLGLLLLEAGRPDEARHWLGVHLDAFPGDPRALGPLAALGEADIRPT
jgi:tetratricopeptide (TPR) repeat protein